MIITYLDRVCISVAGPRIQKDLNLGPIEWGWVAGVFTISYAIFEIPSGALGDRIGPRLVLTRIVLWWSAFTCATGLIRSYYPLLAIRFLFGMGEAGAFPNASVAIARWFPVHERGRAFGISLMASQIGGALTPLLVVPIQVHYGWRASFFVFGMVGILWSAAWFWWFRDSPAEKRGVSAAELEETAHLTHNARHGLPWRIVVRSVNFWATMGLALCYVYTIFFFHSWFHTWLMKARGYGERDLILSSLPFLVAAAGNLIGGLVSNSAVRQVGLQWGRRGIGIAGLTIAGLCIVAVMFTPGRTASLVLLSLAFGAITFQQPSVFALCLDIGGDYAGAVVGAMNTAAQVGALASSLAFGFLVDRYADYNLPFIPMAALLFAGALLWFKTDPLRPLVPEEA